ncbi:cupin domain-containing protein [Burkholderia sp. Ac-20379]|uniref:cupin domain-containing protein n=1 Tax=Burkholderia sp. Ac-20379 TaxID=2703900 RepID=UPI00197FCC04|nr:cupin domain-containing protein [Burkholderia sp. Ac-20379]MBN3727473.1 DUF861 domain-containing protein [Burkholderia sp. Ac-20379]
MHAIHVASPIPALDAWGSVKTLGATVTEGDVQAFGKTTAGSDAAAASAGYFACTRGAFEMVYPFDEHAVVLEGECELLDRSTGRVHRFRPGDAWFVAQGTPVAWRILGERFVKHYFAVSR